MLLKTNLFLMCRSLIIGRHLVLKMDLPVSIFLVVILSVVEQDFAQINIKGFHSIDACEKQLQSSMKKMDDHKTFKVQAKGCLKAKLVTKWLEQFPLKSSSYML